MLIEEHVILTLHELAVAPYFQYLSEEIVGHCMLDGPVTALSIANLFQHATDRLINGDATAHGFLLFFDVLGKVLSKGGLNHARCPNKYVDFVFDFVVD